MVDLEVFTKRKRLSMLASFYDPLIISLKIVMMCQYEEPKSTNWGVEADDCKLGWDDRLPFSLEVKWKEVTKQLVMSEPVHFPRGTKPANARGRLEIIAFWDWSMQSFVTTLFIRWRISGDSPTWSTSLLTAKSSVAPLKRISAVRSELCGAVIMVSLILNVLQALPEKAAQVTMIGDVTHLPLQQANNKWHRTKQLAICKLVCRRTTSITSVSYFVSREGLETHAVVGAVIGDWPP